MKKIKMILIALVIAFVVGGSVQSVSAATSTLTQQQTLMAQQIVDQQVALFQAAGQVLTPEQLVLIQQNANMIVTQQFAILQAQQAAALQAQQAAAAQAQQLAALQAQQAVAYNIPTQMTPSSGGRYVLNKNTKKFHYPHCSSVGDMSPRNRLDVNMSRNDIVAQGYVPCKRCNP